MAGQDHSWKDTWPEEIVSSVLGTGGDVSTDEPFSCELSGNCPVGAVLAEAVGDELVRRICISNGKLPEISEIRDGERLPPSDHCAAAAIIAMLYEDILAANTLQIDGVQVDVLAQMGGRNA